MIPLLHHPSHLQVGNLSPWTAIHPFPALPTMMYHDVWVPVWIILELPKSLLEELATWWLPKSFLVLTIREHLLV